MSTELNWLTFNFIKVTQRRVLPSSRFESKFKLSRDFPSNRRIRQDVLNAILSAKVKATRSVQNCTASLAVKVARFLDFHTPMPTRTRVFIGMRTLWYGLWTIRSFGEVKTDDKTVRLP
jgi:hypothetical protein